MFRLRPALASVAVTALAATVVITVSVAPLRRPQRRCSPATTPLVTFPSGPLYKLKPITAVGKITYQPIVDRLYG